MGLLLLFIGLVVYMPGAVWLIDWAAASYGLLGGLVAFGLSVFVLLVAIFVVADEI
jgi:hypothetical protein